MPDNAVTNVSVGLGLTEVEKNCPFRIAFFGACSSVPTEREARILNICGTGGRAKTVRQGRSETKNQTRRKPTVRPRGTSTVHSHRARSTSAANFLASSSKVSESLVFKPFLFDVSGCQVERFYLNLRSLWESSVLFALCVCLRRSSEQFTPS